MLASDFVNALKENKIEKFFGVPDSLLKNFCAILDKDDNTIAPNEGNAIALACGYYLATNEIGAVYMQNSGLGNCINPLLSLADEDVYNIPLLLIIGLRGEVGIKDEPQHLKQGKITTKLLDTLGIKWEFLNEDYENQIKLAKKYLKETNKIFAFVVKKGTFEEEKINCTSEKYISNFSREEAIKTILEKINNKNSYIFSTTGFTSREVYENSKDNSRNFLTVGSMGHNSSIALQVALEKPEKNIYCFDGDGALLMHLGAVALISSKSPDNFKHILFNNYAHDSVGAQPTVSKVIDYKKLLSSVGYKKTYSISTKEELIEILPEFISNKELSFLEIKVSTGARKDLGRPKETPVENKKIFMEALNEK